MSDLRVKLKVRVRRDLSAQHCVLDVFAGPDEDHLVNCGRWVACVRRIGR